MASVTICSDFGATQNKVSHCFPIYLLWSDGSRCHDLSFLNVELFWFPASTLRCSFCNSPQLMEISFSQILSENLEFSLTPWILFLPPYPTKSSITFPSQYFHNLALLITLINSIINSTTFVNSTIISPLNHHSTMVKQCHLLFKTLWMISSARKSLGAFNTFWGHIWLLLSTLCHEYTLLESLSTCFLCLECSAFLA